MTKRQPKKLLRKIARELLLRWRQRARYDLERKMFPKIKGKKVLFVGVASYTQNYPKKLKANELWTIDINPEVAQFGAEKHIIGSVTNINQYFPENFFDYIFFCGVFGFGINTEKEAEKTMENCYKVLKKGGILVLGWDSYYSPIFPNKLKNFKLFTAVPRFDFPVGYTDNKKVKHPHVYDFLMKN